MMALPGPISMSTPVPKASAPKTRRFDCPVGDGVSDGDVAPAAGEEGDMVLLSSPAWGSEGRGTKSASSPAAGATSPSDTPSPTGQSNLRVFGAEAFGTGVLMLIGPGSAIIALDKIGN